MIALTFMLQTCAIWVHHLRFGQLFLLAHRKHAMGPADGTLAVRRVLHVAQVASAAVCLGCTAAGLYKTDVALAQVPPPEFAAFLSLMDPKLATLLAFAQSLKAVRGWLIFSLAASSVGVIAASLLLAVALSASLRGWLSRTGRHTGALKAEVAVSAILAVLALAAAAVASAKVACLPGTYDGYCDIVNTVHAFSWINLVLWVISVVLGIKDLRRANAVAAAEETFDSMENGTASKLHNGSAAQGLPVSANGHCDPIVAEGGVPAATTTAVPKQLPA